jgi:hypothetical protein
LYVENKTASPATFVITINSHVIGTDTPCREMVIASKSRVAKCDRSVHNFPKKRNFEVEVDLPLIPTLRLERPSWTLCVSSSATETDTERRRGHFHAERGYKGQTGSQPVGGFVVLRS